MTVLPPAVRRQPVHQRAITTQGYLRDDGLWDLEAELVDTKAYTATTHDEGVRIAGEPVHHMRIRLTIDDDFVVHNAVAAMSSTPFPECAPAADPFAALVGARIGAGWRKQVDAVMGGTIGCTHLRELLSVMATVAFQTVPGYRRHERRMRGEAVLTATEPGHQMGKCLAWDFDGPVIARVAPEFIGYRRKKPAA